MFSMYIAEKVGEKSLTKTIILYATEKATPSKAVTAP